MSWTGSSVAPRPGYSGWRNDVLAREPARAKRNGRISLVGNARVSRRPWSPESALRPRSRGRPDLGSIRAASTMLLVWNRLSAVNDRLRKGRFLSCDPLASPRFHMPQACGRATSVWARDPTWNPPSAPSCSETRGVDPPRQRVEEPGNLPALLCYCPRVSERADGVGFRCFQTLAHA
jgi:hypothetical protein